MFVTKFGFRVDAFLAVLAGISLFFGTDFTDYTVFLFLSFQSEHSDLNDT